MSVVTATPHQHAPMSPPARRRLLWATLAFSLGAISGTGITLAVDDDPSGRQAVDAIVSDAVGQPTTAAGGTPSGSPDAIERAAQHRQQTKTANCTRQPMSADAAERCVTAAG